MMCNCHVQHARSIAVSRTRRTFYDNVTQRTHAPSYLILTETNYPGIIQEMSLTAADAAAAAAVVAAAASQTPPRMGGVDLILDTETRKQRAFVGRVSEG